MKRIHKLLPALMLAILSLILLAGCGKEEEQSISVTLVNRSGYDISEIHITPATTDEWGINYAEGMLYDMDSTPAELGSFKAEDIADGFNILVYDGDSELLYDSSFDELAFTLHDGDYLVFLPPDSDTPLDIVSDYDPSDYDDLSAALDPAALAEYTGCWKYDTEPFYMVINEDYEWIAINLYSEQVGPGTIAADADGITLYMDDSSVLTTLTSDGNGNLSDQNGNILLPTDYIMLLPTPDDELNQVAAFPGSFSNVQISYPLQMEAHPHPSVSDALSFNAVMEDGTDDYYSNIMIAFQPISGYDSYMTQGAGTAKPYMKHMLDSFLDSMYGARVLKSFGSNFVDGGDYYSMTGYMWLDGSIFPDGPSQPVRGCMEVRYYGPTGYALVAVTISLEGRIRNYFDICNNMLETLDYSAGWSTAPKPVPAQPAAQKSDPGDYGTPYYWYDEDGDVWYWNGYENEFIGYGDSYYIDDDGQYYESNDAGWDYDDGWGDYVDDYDPWSDPGDGWDDYSYDDEGWGDYFD